MYVLIVDHECIFVPGGLLDGLSEILHAFLLEMNNELGVKELLMRVQLRRGAHFSLDAMLVSEEFDEIWLLPV